MCTIIYAFGICRTKNTSLVIVCQRTCTCENRGRATVKERLVVDGLHVHIVEYLSKYRM